MELKKRIEFKDFYQKYRDKIFYMIYIKVKDHDIAEDLTQDVLSMLVKKWDDIENHYSFAITSTINEIKNYYKKQHLERNDNTKYGSDDQKIIDDHEFINGNFAKTEIEVLFTTALNNLNLDEVDKEILDLKLNKDYTLDKIGKVLGIHPSTIYRKEIRIKKMLKKQFKIMGLNSVKDIIA